MIFRLSRPFRSVHVVVHRRSPFVRIVSTRRRRRFSLGLVHSVQEDAFRPPHAPFAALPRFSLGSSLPPSGPVALHTLHASKYSFPSTRTDSSPTRHLLLVAFYALLPLLLTHDPFHHIVPLDTVTLFPSRTWCAVSGAVHFRSCFPPFVVALLPPSSERFGSAYLYISLSTERCSAGNATVSPQRGSSRRMPVNRPPRQRERLTVTLPPDALGQVTKWYEWLHVLSLCEHFCMHTARWRRPRGGAGFRGVEAKFSLSDRFSWTRRLAYSRAQARLQGGSGRV